MAPSGQEDKRSASQSGLVASWRSCKRGQGRKAVICNRENEVWGLSGFQWTGFSIPSWPPSESLTLGNGQFALGGVGHRNRAPRILNVLFQVPRGLGYEAALYNVGHPQSTGLLTISVGRAS